MCCSERAGRGWNEPDRGRVKGEPLICKMAHPSNREHQGTVCVKTHTHSSPGMHLTPVDDWYARGYFCPTAGKRGRRGEEKKGKEEWKSKGEEMGRQAAAGKGARGENETLADRSAPGRSSTENWTNATWTESRQCMWNERAYWWDLKKMGRRCIKWKAM